MKTSTSLFLTDILPHRRKFFNKIIKNKIFTNQTANQVFTSLKQAGVDGIELLLPSFIKATDSDIAEVKKILHNNKMSILSVHQVIRFLTKTHIDEVRDTFRIAEMVGAEVIVLHTSLAGKQIFNKEYVQTVHDLQKKSGIKVGFENTEKFFGSLHVKHNWHRDVFADLMNKNDFFITLDTTHLAHSGGDISEFFKKNKDRIINIHLSDYRHHLLNSNLRPLRYKHLPLGKGELDIEKFSKTLKKENYKGLVTMEIHTDLTGICESVKMFHSFLK